MVPSNAGGTETWILLSKNLPPLKQTWASLRNCNSQDWDRKCVKLIWKRKKHNLWSQIKEEKSKPGTCCFPGSKDMIT